MFFKPSALNSSASVCVLKFRCKSKIAVWQYCIKLSSCFRRVQLNLRTGCQIIGIYFQSCIAVLGGSLKTTSLAAQ
jgi:hypothetical protein